MFTIFTVSRKLSLTKAKTLYLRICCKTAESKSRALEKKRDELCSVCFGLSYVRLEQKLLTHKRSLHWLVTIAMVLQKQSTQILTCHTVLDHIMISPLMSMERVEFDRVLCCISFFYWLSNLLIFLTMSMKWKNF